MKLQINYKWVSSRYKLSFREWEILMLMLDGKKNSYISKKLGVSMSTIYTYEHSIKLKTNTNTLCETVKELFCNYYVTCAN